MTESVSVATFITETSTTDHASSSIAEAAQELSENISEITLRNLQVMPVEKICMDYGGGCLNLSLSLSLSLSPSHFPLY